MNRWLLFCVALAPCAACADFLGLDRFSLPEGSGGVGPGGMAEGGAGGAGASGGSTTVTTSSEGGGSACGLLTVGGIEEDFEGVLAAWSSYPGANSGMVDNADGTLTLTVDGGADDEFRRLGREYNSDLSLGTCGVWVEVANGLVKEGLEAELELHHSASNSTLDLYATGNVYSATVRGDGGVLDDQSAQVDVAQLRWLQIRNTPDGVEFRIGSSPEALQTVFEAPLPPGVTDTGWRLRLLVETRAALGSEVVAFDNVNRFPDP